MKLIVAELKAAGASQIITPHKNTIVESIRPHLYRHNQPTGSLTLSVEEIGGTVLVSNTVSIDTIGTDSFYHGYIRFDTPIFLAANTQYRIKLTGTDGYSFSESAYCGWCNGFDLGKYAATYTVNSHFQAPLDLEVWARSFK